MGGGQDDDIFRSDSISGHACDHFTAGVDSRPGTITDVTLPNGQTFVLRTVVDEAKKKTLLDLPRGTKLKTRKRNPSKLP